MANYRDETEAQMHRENNDSQYVGPSSGATPTDDSDLHTSGNPFAQGSPEINGTADTGAGYRVGSSAPIGYYTNPPVSPNGNPYSQGVDFDPPEVSAAQSIASGLDAVYADRLANAQPSLAPNPYSDGYQQRIRQDSGQDDQLLPPELRR